MGIKTNGDCKRPPICAGCQTCEFRRDHFLSTTTDKEIIDYINQLERELMQARKILHHARMEIFTVNGAYKCLDRHLEQIRKDADEFLKDSNPQQS